jgi:hypothetical protein
MTKTIFLTATAMLAISMLAGCNKADKSAPGAAQSTEQGQSTLQGKSMEEAKAEAAKLDRPKPGLYKQSLSITKIEIPGAPPGTAAQMQAAMSKADESSLCITAEMADKGFRDMFDKASKSGDCKYDRFDVSGGKVDALLHCENPDRGKGTIAMSGTVGAEGSDITVSIDQQGGPPPMANAKIGMHLVSQRVGECTGTEKTPGA